MQAVPSSLQQAIRCAFRAARPKIGVAAATVKTPRCLTLPSPRLPSRQPRQTIYYPIHHFSWSAYLRDDKGSDIEKKIADARARIDETLESRADDILADKKLPEKDETIIHTVPESSSIVYTSDLPGDAAVRATQQDAASSKPARQDGTEPKLNEPEPKSDAIKTHGSAASAAATAAAAFQKYREALPSQLAAGYSNARQRFSYFMDNFQSHVFIASRRLNDLTGYTGIEALKKDIEKQEGHVRDARQAVREAREAYSSAIDNRSATQREVNDLLHRKHAWSPNDLERFTSLYRSDHANEQAEQKAHENLSKAEAQYEEASTKLAKSILARYHEEQIWSDKIRQMSTWGTWGLMGLNVLLFVVFQILVEPWRRRRLVKGFEEKVQAALKERDADDKVVIDALHDERRARTTATENLAVSSSAVAETEAVAEPVEPTSSSAVLEEILTAEEFRQRTGIEEAVESITNAEVVAEGEAILLASENTADPSSEAGIIDPLPATDQVETAITSETTAELIAPLPSLRDTPWQLLPDALLAYAKTLFWQSTRKINTLFDDQKPVITTQKDFTAAVLEGTFAGAVGMVCLFWACGVGGIRGR